MNRNNTIIRKKFQYNYSKKRSTIVEFDIVEEKGKIVANNITLTSNFRTHFPDNPLISLTPKGEFAFNANGVLITNGDIQQIIKRIFLIVNEFNT
jgi:hypothetical protein